MEPPSRGLSPAGRLVLVEEVDGVGAAQHQQQGVDVLRDAGDHRRIVLAAQRHPGLHRHLAAPLQYSVMKPCTCE
jgi:hypothetical protein